MNLWFAPQISEHCPKNNPNRFKLKLDWFNRPGLASIFTPKEGIVHEWITSVEDTIIRIWVLIGIIRRLLTSNKRKLNSFNSLEGII